MADRVLIVFLTQAFGMALFGLAIVMSVCLIYSVVRYPPNGYDGVANLLFTTAIVGLLSIGAWAGLKITREAK